MEEGRRGAISLTDFWVIEIAGKARRLLFSSLDMKVEILTLVAIVSVAAAGGSRGCAELVR